MKRSKMSLSHYNLLTCDQGELVPISHFEVLPGDTVQQATSMLVRVSPLLSPVMHPVEARIHHWFVPYRLIWDSWEKFITGGPDGNDASVPPHRVGTIYAGTLHDYFGLPVGANVSYSLLPFRAYNLIYNEFYRDQDLQTALGQYHSTSGQEDATPHNLMKVCWEKDYFTSSRPWTQKGDEVSLPLGSSAPVVSDGTDVTMSSASAPNRNVQFHSTANYMLYSGSAAGALQNAKFANSGLEADLSAASSATVNDLRLAMALQRYKEARARYGSRYTEYLRYLGVNPKDARLDRPEYLGGGKQTLQFSEIIQQGTDYNANTGVGTLRGHGIGAMRSNRYRKFFDEHGVVISLLSVKPKTMYSQGLHRSWSRRTKEDYFQRELQHIGQQEVLNKEVYASHSAPEGVFGYQDRYDEYRRLESRVAGDFRSTMNHWHYGRIFAGDVALNASFVESVPTKRVNAVQTNDVLWIMCNHSIQARRLLSADGTPKLI